jgi:hypothetical protein
MLKNRLPKGTCILAGIVRRPLRKVDKSLTIQDQGSKIIRMTGVSCKTHAGQGETNGLSANSGLRMIKRHPSTIDSMLTC